MFTTGQKVRIAGPLLGSVRGEVLRVDKDEVTLTRVQVYAKGCGWFPTVPTEETVSYNSHDLEETHYS